MDHHPKKNATLPKDIETRPDAEVAELIFGKRLKKELDKAVEAVDKKGVPDFMQPISAVLGYPFNRS